MITDSLRMKFWRKVSNYFASRKGQHWESKSYRYALGKYTRAFYDANPVEWSLIEET